MIRASDFLSSALPFLLQALFFCNVFGFARALKHAFVRPDGVRTGMRWVVGIGLFATFASAITLWKNHDASLARWATAMSILAISHSLFRATILATQSRRLSLAFSRDVPAHLNREGPYRYIRHPFYAAYLLTWLGVAVGSGHWTSLVVLAVMAILYFVAAMKEEQKFLHSPLASAYRDYQRATGGFIPRIFANRHPADR